MESGRHPTESDWNAYFGDEALGVRADEVARQVAEHLQSCHLCAAEEESRELAFRAAMPAAYLKPESFQTEALAGAAQAGTLASVKIAFAVPLRFANLRPIGHGGMAEVYEAEDTHLKRHVALKMLPKDNSPNPVDRDRLQREARALAQIPHPNIVTLFDILDIDDRLVLVLERIDGRTLDVFCSECVLTPKEAAEVVGRLAGAMQFVHARGVLHFDLKPDNILLLEERIDDAPRKGDAANRNGVSISALSGAVIVPKITDFGLTRRSSDRIQSDPSAVPSEVGDWTSVGGSPAFASPEIAERMLVLQATPANAAASQSRPLPMPDARSDVYGLAAILYFLLTGRAPYEPLDGESTEAVLQRVVSVPVDSPRRATKTHVVPRDLAAICLKGLARNPLARYSDAHELAVDLTRFLRGEPVVARPAGSFRRLFLWAQRYRAAAALIAVLTIAITLIATFAYEVWKSRNQLDQARQAEQHARERTEESLYHGSIKRAELEYRSGRLDLMQDALEAAPERLRRWEWRVLDRLANAEVRSRWKNQTPRGHISQNGPYAATLGETGHYKVWNSQTGDTYAVGPTEDTPGAAQNIVMFALHPTQPWIAVTHGDSSNLRSTQLWDFLKQQPVAAPFRHSGKLNASQFTADGKFLVLTVDERRIEFRDPQKGELHRELVSEALIRHLTMSPDCFRLALAGGDRRIGIWDVAKQKRSRAYDRHEWNATAMQFHPDNRHVLSASVTVPGLSPKGAGGRAVDDRNYNLSDVRMWDSETGEDLFRLPERHAIVDAIAFSTDGQFAALSYSDQIIEVWELPRPLAAGATRLRARLHSHGRIRSIRFDAADSRLLTTLGDSASRWNWSTASGAYRFGEVEPQAKQSAIFSLGIDASGRILTGHGDGHVKVRDADGNLLLRFPCFDSGERRYVLALACHPQRAWLACCTRGSTIRLFEMVSASPEQLLLQARDIGSVNLGADVCEALQVAFSPDGSWLAVACSDGWVRCWNPEAFRGEPSLSIRHGDARVKALAFRADGRQLASGGDDGRVCFWTIDSHSTGRLDTPAQTFEERLGDVSCLSYSPDGTQIAAGHGTANRLVQVRDAATGKNLIEFRGHSHSVTGIAFHPNEPRLATASKDHTVRIWDTRTGRLLLTLQEHPGAATGVVFSADGRRLVIGGWHDTVSILDGTPRTEKNPR